MLPIVQETACGDPIESKQFHLNLPSCFKVSNFETRDDSFCTKILEVSCRMFRSLSGLADMDHKDFVASQTNKFTEQLPNTYLTGLPTSATTNPKDFLSGAGIGLATWDPNTRRANMTGKKLANYATSIEINQELIDAQEKCKTANLNDLINTYNPMDKVRCGWIYEKGTPGSQPKISQGALGTRNGPAGFFQNPNGRWFWSLEDAQKQILADRCRALTNCANVGSSEFAQCAYSVSRGVGIPVENGRPKYPRDAALNAPVKSLVTTPDRCPPPPSPGTPKYEWARSRDTCMPLPNGNLSRDCMLQQITAAGCKTDGSLYQSLLYGAQPQNYAAALQPQIAYKRYQQLAQTPLFEAALRDGKTTTNMALNNFKELSKESKKVQENVVNYAARDMCIRKGIMDTFDFCLELTDTTPTPISLECIQKEFRKQGGQPAGSMYPSAINKNEWDNLGTWKGIKNAIQQLAADTKSNDQQTQRAALKRFLGIQREKVLSQIGRVPGFEVLWFNRGTNTFLGRRLSLANVSLPEFNWEWGTVGGTGLAENVEFYMVTNLRPDTNQSIRLKVETDDGIAYVLNQQRNIDATRFAGFESTAQSLIANWDQAPTEHTARICWNLKGGGPNYVMGYWQESGGASHHQVFYEPCNGGAKQRIPLDWFTQTQEPDAPFLSLQGLRDPESGTLFFADRRFPSIFNISLVSGSKVVDAAPFGIAKLDAALQSPGGTLSRTSRNISVNSWRTCTCMFIPGRRDAILGIGPLTVVPGDNRCDFVWISATLNVSGQLPCITDGRTPHLFVVNMRSDFNGRFPNRLTVACAPVSEWISGRAELKAGNQYCRSFTTANNQPLYNSTDAYPISLQATPLGGLLAWVRLFDYELDSKDITRDCMNAWEMSFIA
jgi:hypothetical protein